MNRNILLSLLLITSGMMAACNRTCDVDNQSGSVVPGSAEDFATNVPNTIYFDFNKSDITLSAKKRVEAQACWLKTYSSTKGTVEGHCDSRGTAEYNMALGQARADSIVKELKAQGVDSCRLTSVSYGKERLIDDGTSEESHAKNRRGVTVIN
jgi:peptidoglycan-associated lipoprotein